MRFKEYLVGLAFAGWMGFEAHPRAFRFSRLLFSDRKKLETYFGLNNYLTRKRFLDVIRSDTVICRMVSCMASKRRDGMF